MVESRLALEWVKGTGLVVGGGTRHLALELKRVWVTGLAEWALVHLLALDFCSLHSC